MSPNGEEVAAAEGRQQRRADAGRKRAGALEEKKEIKEGPRDTQSKLLDLLTGLTERMERMEASQGRLLEKKRLKGHEASGFGSVLGQGKAMTKEALDVSPPRRVSPGVSPSTYFGARQPGYAGAAANVEMPQAPQPVLPQHYVPPPMYQPAPPPHMGPGLQYDRVPDTRQRKLGIRPFDGKELYQGLGSGFFYRGVLTVIGFLPVLVTVTGPIRTACSA
uniref:Uncharacterized protein n=1 Tax=Peronospora matthiolae TaxID=2874970 RepID=A0AAV1T1I0_9STRA